MRVEETVVQNEVAEKVATECHGDREVRKPYTAPRLTVHGSLSKITEVIRIGSQTP
jgi:hypothetical protein